MSFNLLNNRSDTNFTYKYMIITNTILAYMIIPNMILVYVKLKNSNFDSLFQSFTKLIFLKERKTEIQTL